MTRRVRNENTMYDLIAFTQDREKADEIVDELLATETREEFDDVIKQYDNGEYPEQPVETIGDNHGETQANGEFYHAVVHPGLGYIALYLES